MGKHKTRRLAPGLPPGSLVAREGSGETEIRVVDYNADRFSDERIELSKADSLGAPPPGTLRWIRIRGTPTIAMLEQLGSVFEISRLVLEDIASSQQRVKLEEYPNLLFAVIRELSRDAQSGELVEGELSVVLTKDVLITVEELTDPGWADPILARLGFKDSHIRGSGIDYLHYAILDLVVDRYFPCIDHLESAAEALEQAISSSPTEEHLSQIHHLRGQANRARTVIWSVRDVVSRLQRGKSQYIRESTTVFLRDVADHVLHLLDSTSMLRDTASGLMELYLSRVSNRMNEVMKVLTIISTVFIPITFIAGIYGMNFAHMPELAVRWAYPVVLGVMGVVVVGMLLFFKRRKWF